MADDKFPLPLDPRFTETFAVVHDCGSHGMFDLWRWWHVMLGVPWQEESRGFMRELGDIGGRPTVVSVFWAIIGGKRVAFVDATSQLVDHRLVEKWWNDVFPNRETSSDVTNFGNILSDIARAIGVKSIVERDPRDVEAAAKAVRRNADFMAVR